MGYSKLNIWLRDEKCRPYKIQTALGDRIWIKNCMGEIVEEVPDIPVGEAHVEVRVPPGCYVVQGHVCEHGTNDYTDKAMVVVGCEQELCVNLFVPSIGTCVVRDLAAFVREARIVGVPDDDIRIAARTMMAAGRIPPRVLVAIIERRMQAVAELEGASEVVNEYQATLDIVRE